MTGLEILIANFERQRKEAQTELDLIERLRAEFPDLEAWTGRGRHRFMAVSANPRVDKVMYSRTCGCCSDAPLQAMPYLEFGGVRVYSSPHTELVKNPEWRHRYEKAGISCHLIRKIREDLAEMAREEAEDDDVA